MKLSRSQKYLIALLALTVLLTPVVRLLRQPPKHVTLTVFSDAGAFAPSIHDLEGTAAIDPGRAGLRFYDLQAQRTYRMNVGQSIVSEGFDGSRVAVDREQMLLELTMAGRGEAEVEVGQYKASVDAGENVVIDLPGQPSVARNALDALLLAAFSVFSHWAYLRRHIRGRWDRLDLRGDEVRLPDTR